MSRFGRQLKLFDRRILTVTILLGLAVIVMGTFDDHRSCNRAMRISAAHNAAIDASAVARLSSALIEPEPQKSIDIRAARDLLHAKLRPPDCNGLVPNS